MFKKKKYKLKDKIQGDGSSAKEKIKETKMEPSAQKKSGKEGKRIQ